MASRKRARDYAAEEAARNRRARELGFSSRAQMRRALAQGRWTPTRATASPRSRIIVDRKVQPPAPPPPARRRYGRVMSISDAPSLRRVRHENQEWSDRHSRVESSKYDKSMSADRARKYHAAFVDPNTRAWKIENGLDSLRDWLVDELGYYTDDVFDEKYGIDMSSFPAKSS